MDQRLFAWRQFHMRTLLTNVNGFSELLADPGGQLPEAVRLEYAEIVYASGLRLLHLIEHPEEPGGPDFAAY